MTNIRNQHADPQPQPVDLGSGQPPESGVLAAAAPNPFDPARLRLSQNFAMSTGVKKLVTTVPVRKPDKEWFNRVHLDPGYSLETAVIERKEDRETYLVEQSLWPELASESTFCPRALFTGINRQGVLFLWPVRLPGTDGKLDNWSASALEAINRAKEGWIRVGSNMSLGAYEIYEAKGAYGEPEWPDLSFSEILRIAFKDRFINSMDHPVLRKLRGEI